MRRITVLPVLLSLILALGAPTPGALASDGYTGAYDRLGGSVTFGGYHEFEYEDAEGSPGDFDQHRTILFFGAQPHERIRFFNELEIEHGGHPDVKLEQSWLEFSINGNHNFRAGIDLIPVGRMNLEHDGNLRDFVFRPFVDDRLIPTTWFEAGVGFNGALTNALSYQVGISNGMVPTGNAGVGTRGEFDMAPESVVDESDPNNSKATWGRLLFNPVLGTEVALSGYQSAYDAGGNRDISFVALDFNHITGPWEFTGEFVDVSKDQQSFTEGTGGIAVDFDGDGINGETIRGLDGGDGGYVEAAYHFFPTGWYDAWFARGFDNPTFTALARYEQLNYDEPSSGGAASVGTELDESYLTLGLNYRPLEAVALKVSYDFQSLDNNAATERDRFGFGTVIGF